MAGKILNGRAGETHIRKLMWEISIKGIEAEAEQGEGNNRWMMPDSLLCTQMP